MVSQPCPEPDTGLSGGYSLVTAKCPSSQLTPTTILAAEPIGDVADSNGVVWAAGALSTSRRALFSSWLALVERTGNWQVKVVDLKSSQAMQLYAGHLGGEFGSK